MREIIFRGKRFDNGEWVYGVPIFDWYSGGKTANIINVGLIECCDENMVIPETVGQYTGLEDKNGKMIFEGDKFKRNGHIGIVTWVYSGWYVFFDDSKLIPLFDNLQWDWSLHEKEIIGNIHDQKEDV